MLLVAAAPLQVEHSQRLLVFRSALILPVLRLFRMITNQEQVLSVFCVVEQFINGKWFVLADKVWIVDPKLSVADHFIRLTMPKPNQGEDTHIFNVFFDFLCNRVTHSFQFELVVFLL